MSQGRICSDNFTCCHTEIEAADQSFYPTQSLYSDTEPTSLGPDPITPSVGPLGVIALGISVSIGIPRVSWSSLSLFSSGLHVRTHPVMLLAASLKVFFCLFCFVLFCFVFVFVCFCFFVGCLMSHQDAYISQGQVCSMCCHAEREVADQNFYLTQSQYIDTGTTSPSADPITPGAWQGSHRRANVYFTGMTRPGKIP